MIIIITSSLVDLAVLANHRKKIKDSEKNKDKYFDINRESEKTMKYEGDGSTNSYR